MDFSEIKNNYNRFLLEKEVAVSTSISELESGEVLRVLGIQAVGRIVSIDVQNNTAKCFLRINYKLLILNKDGETRGVDYFADFTENIQIDTLSDKINGTIEVIDTEVTIGGGIKLTSMIGISLYSIDDNDIKLVTETSDNIYAEKGAFTFSRLVGTKTETFAECTDIDTNKDISKILFTDVAAVVDRLTSGMGNVLAQGKLVGEITYLVEDKIVVEKINVPYSEEFEFEGVEIGDVVRAGAEVKSYRVTLTGVEGSNILHIECEINLNMSVFANETLEYVKDVFSVERELDVDFIQGSVNKLFDTKFLLESVSGIAEIPESESGVLEVMGVISEKNAVAQTIVDDGKVVIEGVYSATILYRSEEGFASANLEIPYSIPFEDDNFKRGNNAISKGVVIDSVATLKRAREIELVGSIGFAVNMDEEENIRYIVDVKDGAEKEMNTSAVSVYITGEDESIYDVAKALSARPDDILSQNSDIVEPFKEGDKLFYFRGITFNF